MQIRSEPPPTRTTQPARSARTPSFWRIWISLAVFLFLFLAGASFSPSRAGPEDPEPPAGPEPTPTQIIISPRQERPDLPENPSAADLGHITWWSVCMACHGDAGQGLTDEWRQTAFGEDKDCWTSKCHGARHPPEGFTFPRIVPPAWGSGALKRFVTADELQAYLYEAMPWWNPGSLSETEAWQLTNFILRESGSLPPELTLTPENAGLAPVHLAIRPLESERGWSMVWVGLVGLASVALIALRGFAQSNQAGSRLNREKAPRPSFFHHLHPPTIPLAQARWTHTFGLGGMAVFLSLILAFTGILELFFYVPTPAEAAQSVQTITFLVPYGGIVRGLHFWAAQALVVVAVLHLLRVVFTGAITPPRRFNYWIGLALLVIVLLLDFTGYVLRWDEGIRWALLVGTNLLKTIPLAGERLYWFVIGGDSPGAPALLRFYAWHIFGLAVVMTILVAWHIFRVRRDGGIAAPPPELRPDPRRITRFELVRREALAMLIVTALLTLAAVLLPAPLAPSIQDSPGALMPDARAPWFFLWIQRLLRLGDSFWMGVALPLGLLALLALLPALIRRQPPADLGRWFAPAARPAAWIGALVVLTWLALTLLEVLK